MSYLDQPRIHVLGKFFTDPSTVNNDPSHWDPACKNPSPWQEPTGLHRFKVTEATVCSGMMSNGILMAGNDSILGASLTSVEAPSAAKIVDLDVYQQGVTCIYGLKLQLDMGGGKTWMGEVIPPTLNSCRFTRVLPTRGWNAWDEYGASSFGGDSYGVGFFQSVVRVSAEQWQEKSGSQLLDQLRKRTLRLDDGTFLVSIRFVLDGYQNVPGQVNHRYGRFLATLGPVLSQAEPPSCPGARWMKCRPLPAKNAPWFWPDLYDVPFKFIERDDGSKAIAIDMSNGLATVSSGGSILPLGTLKVLVGSKVIGTFEANDNLYDCLGGIIELPITEEEFNSNSPVTIESSGADVGGPVLWAESPSGLSISAVERAMRLEPPGGELSEAVTRVHVTQWGKPIKDLQLAVQVVSVINGIKGATVPWVAGYKGNSPEAEGALQASISPTNEEGYATVTLKVVKNPGSRTDWLDGQLYFINVYNPRDGTPDLTKAPHPQEQQVSCVVWSDYQVNTNPSWDEVKRLLEPYAKLYPGMAERVDFIDAQTFYTFALNPPWSRMDPPANNYVLPNGQKISAGTLPYFFLLQKTDPRYMPLSRDLSPNKLLTILYYIAGLQQTNPNPS